MYGRWLFTCSVLLSLLSIAMSYILNILCSLRSSIWIGKCVCDQYVTSKMVRFNYTLFKKEVVTVSPKSVSYFMLLLWHLKFWPNRVYVLWCSPTQVVMLVSKIRCRCICWLSLFLINDLRLFHASLYWLPSEVSILNFCLQ